MGGLVDGAGSDGVGEDEDFVRHEFFSGAENIFSGTMFELRKAIFHSNLFCSNVPVREPL
jgi:hypothetical protein